MSAGRRGRPSGRPAGRPSRGRPSRDQPARGQTSRGRPSGGGRASGRSAARPTEARRTTGPRPLGGEQVEGRQAVRELLLAGRRRTTEVWVAEDVEAAGPVADVLDLAAELRVPLRRVGRRRLEDRARSEAPQGVLALAAPLPEADLDDLCVAGPAPFLVFLDGITDPQNLGGVLRSAECAGATGAVLPRHRAATVTPTVAKAAAGAIEHLALATVPGIPAALARARAAGLWVLGLDAAGETSLFDFDLGAEPVGLVLGAEGRGLGRLTRERCDVLASVPLHGALGSLNVAATAALACYEVARQR